MARTLRVTRSLKLGMGYVHSAHSDRLARPADPVLTKRVTLIRQKPVFSPAQLEFLRFSAEVPGSRGRSLFSVEREDESFVLLDRRVDRGCCSLSRSESQFPDLDRVVKTGRGQSLSIRAECHTADSVIVSFNC